VRGTGLWVGIIGNTRGVYVLVSAVPKIKVLKLTVNIGCR